MSHALLYRTENNIIGHIIITVKVQKRVVYTSFIRPSKRYPYEQFNIMYIIRLTTLNNILYNVSNQFIHYIAGVLWIMYSYYTTTIVYDDKTGVWVMCIEFKVFHWL